MDKPAINQVICVTHAMAAHEPWHLQRSHLEDGAVAFTYCYRRFMIGTRVMTPPADYRTPMCEHCLRYARVEGLPIP